ncbi:MAG: T9SS type A sorting domain-containing protein [Chitinophagaceae bacterium]|nr:T9SS type A sorting domain-containing protein [Chitinophagaceae bacterium]MBP9104017.1 T9SS type A sorting domain-containing protein [Chitinophagaceae bacterium]
MKTIFTSLKLLLLTLIFSQIATAQNIGDYQTTASGAWSSSASWARWDGLGWNTPATPPTSADGLVTILTGHTVSVDVAAATASRLTIASGANLQLLFTDGSAHPLTISDGNGSGDDLIVNGTLLIRGFRSLNGATGATAQVNGTMDFLAGTLRLTTTISSGGIMNVAPVSGTDQTKFVINADITNNGTINWSTAAGAGSIQLTNSLVTNNGIINENFIGNGTTGIHNTGGGSSFINNGTIDKNTAFLLQSNPAVPFTNTGIIKGIGELSLTGTISNTGTITPGNSPGILTLNSNLVTGQTPTIRIEILGPGAPNAGTNYDQLTFNAATVDVSGTTLIVEEDDVNAQPGIYTIMNNTGGNFVGNFATVVIPLGYTITYNPAGSATVVVTKLGSTLPAVWGDFNALAKNNNRVNLNWSTLQENNVSHYTVEYSANGRDYTSIGTVAAAGNTTNVTNYSFVHNTPDVQKTNYYRIRQSDLDGKTAYSVIRPVRFSKGTVAPILVTPNPVRDRLQLSVQAENIRIMLVDLSGRTLKNMNLQPGNHELSVTELAPGMYHLVIFQDGLRLETQKLIKQ